MKLTPSTSLAEFLEHGAMTICFSPEYSEERALWHEDDGYVIADGLGGEEAYKTLQEALDAMVQP